VGLRLASRGTSPSDGFSFFPPWSMLAIPSEVTVLVVPAIALALLVGCALELSDAMSIDASNLLVVHCTPNLSWREGKRENPIGNHMFFKSKRSTMMGTEQAMLLFVFQHSKDLFGLDQ
jgi:hypothetical protein